MLILHIQKRLLSISASHSSLPFLQLVVQWLQYTYSSWIFYLFLLSIFFNTMNLILLCKGIQVKRISSITYFLQKLFSFLDDFWDLHITSILSFLNFTKSILYVSLYTCIWSRNTKCLHIAHFLNRNSKNCSS